MPSLLPCFGSSASAKLVGGVVMSFGIVENDLARIDVPDAVRILHLRQQVLRIRDLRVVDRQAEARIVHLVHLRRAQALAGRSCRAAAALRRASSRGARGRRRCRERPRISSAPSAACRCSSRGASNSRRPTCRGRRGLRTGPMRAEAADCRDAGERAGGLQQPAPRDAAVVLVHTDIPRSHDGVSSISPVPSPSSASTRLASAGQCKWIRSPTA